MSYTPVIYDLGRDINNAGRMYLVACDASGESDISTTLYVSIRGVVDPIDFESTANVRGSGSTALYLGLVTAPQSGQITISARISNGGSASKSINLASAANDGSTTLYVPTRMYSGDVGGYAEESAYITGNTARTYELRAYTALSSTSNVNLSSTYFTVGSGMSAGPGYPGHENPFSVTDQQLAQLIGPTEQSRTLMLVAVGMSGGKIVSAGVSRLGATVVTAGMGFWPSVGSLALSDSEGHTGKFGVFVQGHSVVEASVPIEAKHGASITSVAFSMRDGATDLKSQGTSGAQTLGTPTVTGERRVDVLVMDSRGYTQGGSAVIRVGAYKAPEITELYAARWSGAEEDDSSDTVRIDLTGSVCVINGVAASGTATFRARENAQGTDWTGLGVNEVAGNFGTTTRDATAQDVETSFVYQVVLEDEFGTQATAEAQVGTVRPIIDFSVGGEAIGFWTAAAEREYQGGDPARGIFLDNDFILSEGRCVSGSGATESGELVYDRLMRASYNYATDSFILELLQHAVLANGKHLSAMNASGNITRLLGINSRGNTELNWTSGGLRGRVFKLLWSGSASAGAKLTISELPYYNVFVFLFQGSSGNSIITTVRMDTTITAVGGSYAGSVFVQVFWATISGTTLTVGACYSVPLNNGTNQSGRLPLTRVYGVI